MVVEVASITRAGGRGSKVYRLGTLISTNPTLASKGCFDRSAKRPLKRFFFFFFFSPSPETREQFSSQGITRKQHAPGKEKKKKENVSYILARREKKKSSRIDLPKDHYTKKRRAKPAVPIATGQSRGWLAGCSLAVMQT